MTRRASIPWAGHEYDRVLNNKNKLLSTYPGATGIKTGTTEAAVKQRIYRLKQQLKELNKKNSEYEEENESAREVRAKSRRPLAAGISARPRG